MDETITLHHMHALLEPDEFCRVYNVHDGSLENGSPMVVGPSAPEIANLLTDFATLFEVPDSLPTHQMIDHRIHLFLNTIPINVRPY